MLRNIVALSLIYGCFIDRFRDLGFLQRPGIETKPAKDVATFVGAVMA